MTLLFGSYANRNHVITFNDDFGFYCLQDFTKCVFRFYCVSFFHVHVTVIKALQLHSNSFTRITLYEYEIVIFNYNKVSAFMGKIRPISNVATAHCYVTSRNNKIAVLLIIKPVRNLIGFWNKVIIQE